MTPLRLRWVPGFRGGTVVTQDTVLVWQLVLPRASKDSSVAIC